MREIVEINEELLYRSRGCGRVGVDVSEWFPINVGLRKGVMCLWLFNLYVYGWYSVRGEC